MAAISTFSFHSRASSTFSNAIPTQLFSASSPCFASIINPTRLPRASRLSADAVKFPSKNWQLSSVAQETLTPELPNREEESAVTYQPSSAPLLPSDRLIMFFQADGLLSEAAIPTVTRSLEGIDGISDIKVLLDEGIASVELKKQTSVQATGVASDLVETLQNSGFKVHTLNLSFEDDVDNII